MAFNPLKVLVLKGPLLRQAGVIVRIVMLLLVLLLAGGFFWSATNSKSRVVLLEAETQVVTLRSLGQGSAWNVPNAIICRPRVEGINPDLPSGDGPCDQRRFDVSDEMDVTIELSTGYSARISTNESGLTITTLNDFSNNWSDGTRVHVPSDSWGSMGALTFAAELTVGDPLQSGLTSQLLGGRWEMRQSGWAIAPGRNDVTEIVKEGSMISGSVVEVWENCPPTSDRSGCGPRVQAPLYGHFMPVNKNGEAYMELVALSAPGQTELSIGYFGATAPSIIRPSLLDFAITSPLLLAVAFILSITASLVQVLTSLPETMKGGKRNQAPG